MPTKTWVVGEEVLAADFNAFVQQQVVATFPNAAARDAALPSPTEGMVIYLGDVNQYQWWTGTTWNPLPVVYDNAGNPTPSRIRAGVLIGSTDANAALGLTWTPPLGTIRGISTSCMPGNNSLQVAIPAAGQWVAGAGSTQWVILGAGGPIASAVVQLSYTVVDG